MATKIGIIGAGGMLQYHAAGFKQAGGEIVAVADMAPGAADSAAKEWGIAEAYTSVEEMLEKSEIDAVSVIVPNKFHAPLAIQCMNAGKHVFCEKPPALSAAELEEMIKVSEATGKKLMFNFNNRSRPESREMKRLFENGTFGTVNSAQAKWARRTGIPGIGGWFTNKQLAGGGALIDLLHMVDLAMYFMDYPEPSFVLGKTFDTHITNTEFKGPWGIADNAEGITDVEAAAHGFITFKTGQTLSFQVSWAEMIKREEVSVVFQGTKGGGKVERLFAEDGVDETAIDTCEIYLQEGGKPVDKLIEVEECEDMGRISSAANFVEAIEGTAKPLNTPQQALILMKVIDGIYKSSETGAPVAI